MARAEGGGLLGNGEETSGGDKNLGDQIGEGGGVRQGESWATRGRKEVGWVMGADLVVPWGRVV